MNLSLITTTICLPTLLEMLGSVKRFPDQTLCIINRVSQRGINPILADKMRQTEFQVRKLYPFIEFLEVTHEATWGSVNQQFNIGMRAAQNDYVAIMHDDLILKDFDYFGVFADALDLLPDAEAECGHRLIGLNFSAFEGGAKVVSPAVPATPLYWQPFPPTTIVIDRRMVAEAGWFDETYGVWYDAHMQAEVVRRGWYFMYLPVPMAHHHSGRSFSVTRYPRKWIDCAGALKRAYPSLPDARSVPMSEAMQSRVREIVEAHA
jgi:hypothetical protein